MDADRQGPRDICSMWSSSPHMLQNVLHVMDMEYAHQGLSSYIAQQV